MPVVLLVGEAEHEGALTPEELQLLQAEGLRGEMNHRDESGGRQADQQQQKY